MSDYGSANFIQLESTRGQETFTGFENESLLGIPCIRCKDGCPGFAKHPWRRGCGNCKCAAWEHDVPEDAPGHPFDRMCVEESLPPLSSEYDTAITEGYLWVPRGLTGYEIEQFMGQLPNHKIPRKQTPGAAHRARQILFQVPRQDFSKKHTRFLKGGEGSDSFDDMCNERNTALGIGAVVPRLRSSMDCAQCKRSVSVGSMGVFAEKAGSNRCWHVGCFCCSKCDELLVDLIYCFKEGNIYCPRHYLQTDKPRCGGCEEIIIVGDYTQAMDKDFHMDHFSCNICDLPMSGKKYIVHSGKPVCENCFKDKLANVCFSCRKPIGPESKDMFVKDKHYHKECLRCTQCHKQLETKTFVLVNNQMVCNDCRGTEPPSNCSGCNEEFSADEKKIGIKETNECFHERCFKCDVCGEPIGVKKFVKKADGTRVCGTCFDQSLKNYPSVPKTLLPPKHSTQEWLRKLQTNSKPFARPARQSGAGMATPEDMTLCARCNEAIRGAVVNFDDKPFHSECFDCFHCHRPLAGKPFYRHEEGLYCDECYVRLHAKRCAFCTQPIEGNTKFVDYNNQYFHNDCFTCAGCYKPLAGSKFIVRDDKRFCTDCR